jgi:hypothetical protein
MRSKRDTTCALEPEAEWGPYTLRYKCDVCGEWADYSPYSICADCGKTICGNCSYIYDSDNVCIDCGDSRSTPGAGYTQKGKNQNAG